MLFLHNLEKAVKIFLAVARWIKLSLSLVRETILAYPFEIVSELFAPLSSLFTAAMDFFRVVIDNLDDVLLAPFKFVSSYFSGLGIIIEQISFIKEFLFIFFH